MVHAKFEEIIQANNQEYDKLMVYQKLENILNDLQDVDNLKSLW